MWSTIRTRKEPPDRPYGFIYHITIHNDSPRVVTIRGRKWVVTNSDNSKLVIEGTGVVGECPRLTPGTQFHYQSYHLIGSDSVAEGSYLGQLDDGERVFTRILRGSRWRSLPFSACFGSEAFSATKNTKITKNFQHRILFSCLCGPPLMTPLALFPNFLSTPRGLEVIGFLFWIWMIYECAVRERNSSEKVMWLVLVIFAPVIGSLIYFLLRVVKVRG